MPTWLLLYLESIVTARLHPIVAILVIAILLYLVFIAISDVFTPYKNGN